MGRACAFARDLPWLDAVVISSDDDRILAEAVASNNSIITLRRPDHLATDEATTEEVWRHAWLHLEEHSGKDFGLSVLFEPTSPFRTPEDAHETVTALLTNNVNAVATVSRTPSHFSPYKALTVGSDGTLGFFVEEGNQYRRRQDAPAVFHRNGLCYAAKRQAIVEEISLLEGRCLAVVIDRPVINIDDELDLQIARWLWRSVERP